MGEPQVVIVGGGFGGLYAAKALRDAPVRVTVLDRHNHHLFQPLLYQVATAALNPSEIATPIRHVLRGQENATVLLAEVQRVDVPGRRVVLTDGELAYDHLILAAGVTHSYLGHDGWSAHAPGLKTVEDALEIRRRILLAFEAAERETDAATRRAWLTFVVVGAGPTGVELAGALTEIARRSMAHDFRRINPADARVLLIEGADRVLPGYPNDLSASAQAQLTRLGVEVRVGARVTAVDAHGVTLGGETLPARTTLWAAGVAASPLAASLGVPLDRAGRVKVTPELSIPGHDEVYVIGDLAAVESDGKPVPGVAQGAIQGGRHAADNIVRGLRGEPRRPFRYGDKGSLATIGRAAAVADLGRTRLSGLSAWLVWAFVHVMFLIGFRNRVFVMLQWMWSFVTFKRGARLITGPTPGDLVQARALPTPIETLGVAGDARAKVAS